jgi:putative membrane protein
MLVMSGTMLGYAMIHGSARYGWRPTLLFLVVAFVIGNVFENLSITTGFPYGYFHHLPVAGPRIFHVPIVVGLSHAAAAYLAWSMGSVLLSRADADPDRWAPLAIAIVGGFVVTGWDATGDATGATVARGWVYPAGGGYFGVPLSNFLGWLLAGSCYALAGGLCVRRAGVRPQPLGWSLQPQRSCSCSRYLQSWPSPWTTAWCAIPLAGHGTHMTCSRRRPLRPWSGPFLRP